MSEDITFKPSFWGYLQPSEWVNFVFNVPVALILLILNVPIIIIISLVIWRRDGRPVFYAGNRLGRNKKIFKMYKFRTLSTDASDKLGPELLGQNHQFITRTGRFLRDTKLDELPQLWNIVKRDMDLVGFRPTRPDLYEKVCKDINGYDRRFKIRPGLIGFSQLYTPHSGPKRFHSYIDNQLLKKKEHFIWSIYLLGIASLLVFCRIVCHSLNQFFTTFIPQKIMRKYKEKRAFKRVPIKLSQVFLTSNPDKSKEKYIGSIRDINPEAFLLRSNVPRLEDSLPAILKLQVDARKIGRLKHKTKTAYCEGQLFRQTQVDDDTWDYVIMFNPTTPLNFYLINQYFLRESLMHYN